MTLTSLIMLLSIGGSLIILALAWTLLRYQNQIKNTTKKLSTTQIQLHNQIKKQENLQTELTRLKSKLEDSVLTDPLTDLPSRKIFEDRLETTLNQSTRYQLIFGILFLDIDGFKMINDALGHDIGDELLRQVAERMQITIRQVDTMSRFAGDEFVFLLPQLAKPETAAYVAQRFLDVISQPFQIHDENLYITASIGIAVYPLDGNDSQTLLKHATNALHQAKSRGRNMYQFYRSDMHSLSRRALMLSSSLRSDTVYQEFLLYFQPQVNVETKQIVCMEAQLHWHHGDFGTIPWEEFSRLAENSGKVVSMGEWLLRQACQNFLTWQKNDFYPSAISVSITLKQIENPHFIQKISTILQELKVHPENIILELDEAPSLSRFEAVEKMLHMIKHLGVHISISHFGTGHLSLQDLLRLPIDFLKIDAGLIRNITVSKENEAIVKMIITLGKSLQKSVFAEGVESKKQMQLLLDLGCTIMQGPLFAQFALPSEFNASTIDKITERLS